MLNGVIGGRRKEEGGMWSVECGVRSEECGREDVGVLLSVGKDYRDCIALDILQCSLEQDAFAHIWLRSLGIGIKVNHVAWTEIRKEVITLIGHTECKRVETIVFSTLLLLQQLQTNEDIPHFPLLVQRHVPEVGSAPADTFLRTQLTDSLLTIYEGHHGAIIGSFKRGQAMKRGTDALQRRQFPTLIEFVVELFDIHRFRTDQINDRLEAVAGDI